MSTSAPSRTNISDPTLTTGWGVIFWDNLEYQSRPMFANRDDHILLVYREQREAAADAAACYRGTVVRIVGGSIV